MRSLNCEHTVYECKRAFFKTRSVQSMGIAQGLGISQQAFCNAKFAFVRTNALLATTMRPFCPQFVIFRLEKKAMAKTKAEEKALNLD